MSEKYKMTVNIDLGRDIVFGKMCSALGVSKTVSLFTTKVSKLTNKFEHNVFMYL